MPDNEYRMREIELQVERIVGARSDHQRLRKRHTDRYREASRAALGSLNLDLTAGDGATGRGGKSGFRIRGDYQRNITGVAADRDGRCGVGAHRDAHIAEELTDLIELLEVDHGSRGRRGIHG